jgi:diguanylate cyclase (GGDEF)-like protein
MTALLTALTGGAAAAAAAGWTLTARRLHGRTAALEQERHRTAVLEHDGLTGLWRREAFEQLAPAALATGNAIALLDIDRFKAINDTCGHATGDIVLRTLAGRLAAELGETAILARLGGDEFAAITTLEFPSPHGQLEQLATALTAPVTVPGAGELAISVSIGVAWLCDLPTFDEPAASSADGDAGDFWAAVLSEGLAAADAAMYAAKALRQTWRLYDRDIDPVRPASGICPAPQRRYREHGPAALRDTPGQGSAGLHPAITQQGGAW